MPKVCPAPAGASTTIYPIGDSRMVHADFNKRWNGNSGGIPGGIPPRSPCSGGNSEFRGSLTFSVLN